MSQETIKEKETTVTEPDAKNAETVTPVFEEADNMDEAQAINVLIQASTLAQQTGKLSVRDSVLLAKAIETVRPGSI
tara:strand:+ start:11086 stop:11316 length:231 start_codon:yes stop_codon:yes gene_type:complete